jgi:hypothetical protein
MLQSARIVISSQVECLITHGRLFVAYESLSLVPMWNLKDMTNLQSDPFTRRLVELTDHIRFTEYVSNANTVEFAKSEIAVLEVV